MVEEIYILIDTPTHQKVTEKRKKLFYEKQGDMETGLLVSMLMAFTAYI
jgi:hypothetical protein